MVKDNFVYIKLLDNDNPCLAIFKIREQDHEEFLKIVREVRKSEDYNFDVDGNGLIEVLNRHEFEYETLEIENVYF